MELELRALGRINGIITKYRQGILSVMDTILDIETELEKVNCGIQEMLDEMEKGVKDENESTSKV